MASSRTYEHWSLKDHVRRAVLTSFAHVPRPVSGELYDATAMVDAVLSSLADTRAPEPSADDLVDLARAEAERRWPSPNSGLYEGLQSGFALGAEWALRHPSRSGEWNEGKHDEHAFCDRSLGCVIAVSDPQRRNGE